MLECFRLNPVIKFRKLLNVKYSVNCKMIHRRKYLKNKLPYIELRVHIFILDRLMRYRNFACNKISFSLIEDIGLTVRDFFLRQHSCLIAYLTQYIPADLKEISLCLTKLS